MANHSFVWDAQKTAPHNSAVISMKKKNAQIFQLFARYWPPFFYLACIAWVLVWEKLPRDQDPYTFDPETIGSTILFFIIAVQDNLISGIQV